MNMVRLKMQANFIQLTVDLLKIVFGGEWKVK